MTRIDRRTALRGLGIGMALPFLDAMTAIAATPKPPLRAAFLYVPNGKNMVDWTPTTEGKLGELPAILKPLQDLAGDFSILSNLTADKARAHGDGGGDHARALAAFLTGTQPRKTDGTDIRNGISVDQAVAQKQGEFTRLPSLEIGGEAGGMAGNCDSGYSCVYSSTMSWKSATQPLPKLVNPKLVFDRLFGGGSTEERAKLNATRKSVLDFVREDSKDLLNQVGSNDRRKLDEYFGAIRDIETRIARSEKLPAIPTPKTPAPTAIPANYDEHLRMLADLMVLAFQTDMTRVCTFVFANEGSTKPYPFIGVPEGHHDLSHHENNPKKKEKIRDINTFHVTQLAYLLNKLKEVKEGDGTLLDHCMIAYGSGNSDGNRHNHDELPILLAGKANGRIKQGRHVRYAKETPLANLWLSMLERMDVSLTNFGDSTGALKGLEA